MKGKSLRVLTLIMIAAMVIGSIGACGPTVAPTEKVKIGLSFSDFATERWKPESELLTKLLN